MNAAEIIAKKRDGKVLTDEEIRWFIEGFTSSRIPEYQMSALAMAIFFRSMNANETESLTRAMLESGAQLERNPTGPPRVDKHSTGGLGDKVSLILAPLLACCEVHVPMISGRGLGFSGGTLDKLEAIPGYQVQLDDKQTQRLLKDAGCFIVAADQSLVPADRRLYALRDVTATVESVPLITASILSKKLAARLDALVMDVKVGSAAFMKTIKQATALAQSISATSTHLGTPCVTFLTDMEQPLGIAVGNALEVNESVEVLRGQGPATVRELTLGLCAAGLLAIGRHPTKQAALDELSGHLDSGRAFERFEKMVAGQGGQISQWPLPVADNYPVVASRSGYLQAIEGYHLGQAVIELGGGRQVISDRIDPTVGLSIHKRIGDRIEKGETLCDIHAPRGKALGVLPRVAASWTIVDEPVPPLPLFIESR